MTLESAIHYYYSGGNLIQEFDEMYEDSTVADDLTWDYLRGLGGQVVRRRKHEASPPDSDMLHFNDMMAIAREVTILSSSTPRMCEYRMKKSNILFSWNFPIVKDTHVITICIVTMKNKNFTIRLGGNSNRF